MKGRGKHSSSKKNVKARKKYHAKKGKKTCKKKK